MVKLAFAAFFFLALHLGVAATAMRANLVAWMGLRPYRVVFAMGSLLSLSLLFVFYREAKLDSLNWGLWEDAAPLRVLAAIVQIFAYMLFFAAIVPGAKQLAVDGEVTVNLAQHLSVAVDRWPLLKSLGLEPSKVVVSSPALRSLPPLTPAANSGVTVSRLQSLTTPKALKGEVEPLPPIPAVRGVWRISRHPRLWGIGLWALAHMIARFDLAGCLVFGALFMTCVLYAPAWDQMRGPLYDAAGKGEDWKRFLYRTSTVPFKAILDGRNRMELSEIGILPLMLAFSAYAVTLALHELLFGVPPV